MLCELEGEGFVCNLINRGKEEGNGRNKRVVLLPKPFLLFPWLFVGGLSNERPGLAWICSN